MFFKIVILVFALGLKGCTKGANSKGEFRANVQDNRQVINQTSPDELPGRYFEIELGKEKEKLKEIILRSAHKNEVKEQAVNYIDNFDYSQIKNMKDFMEIFLAGLMRILPDGLRETLDVAVDASIVAANSPVTQDDTNIRGLKQDILKEVIKRTAIQKSIREEDVKAVISDAIRESGYWEGADVDAIISRVNEEILNEPEIAEALTEKAVKLTMNGCVDPDLSKVPVEVELTLCDGTLVKGQFTSTVASPDLSLLIPSNLRNGVTIAGITGSYPSSEFPLENSSSTKDLSDSNFNSSLLSSENFEWFDSSGNRFSQSGSTNLAEANNIKDGIFIFGIEGTYSVANPPIGLDGFSVSQGSKHGDIDITIDFPADTSSFELAKIIRKTGSAPTEADCHSNNITIIKSYDTFIDDSFTVQGLTDNDYYFRTCILNQSLSGSVGQTKSKSLNIYQSNFSALNDGDSPADWADTHHSNSLSFFDTFGIAILDSEKVLRPNLTNNQNFHTHYDGAGAASLTNYSFSGQFRMEKFTTTVGFTLFSDYPNSDEYYRIRRFAENNVFHVTNHGSLDCVGKDVGSFLPGINTWNHFYLEAFDNGTETQIRAKFWKVGTEEPLDWEIDCIDEATGGRRTAGPPGFWAMNLDDNNGYAFYKDLSIAPLQ